MFDPTSHDSTPRFGTAEYAGVPGELRCHFCKQPTPQQYYRVGTVTACGTCAEIARQQMPKNTHTAFSRALLFGIGTAIVGLVGYATLVIIFRGWTIGYISVGVGYIVGKAMMIGSKGIGGRKFQIAAALLTYAAVSMAEVPIELVLFAKHKPTQQEQVQEEQRQFEKEFGQQSQAPAQPEPTVHRRLPLGRLIGYLALLGLASPFLALSGNPVWGAIGLVILFVGIQIAWRITAGRPVLEIFGPFDTAMKPA
jgi:hypothetical protein